MSSIHPTALIHPTAQLGAGVAIGPFTVVDGHASIGDGTRIESHVRIGAGAMIGRECQVFHGAVVAATPASGVSVDSPPCTVRIGDRTIIREFASIDCGATPGEDTVLGAQCLLMVGVHIAPGCVIGDVVIMANDSRIGAGVRIDDYAILGGKCGVDASVRIGKHCMIGGTSDVVRDVPPFALAGHTPLAFQGLNLIGLRRRGFTTEVIRMLDAAYAILYADAGVAAEALARIKAECGGHAEIDDVISFVATSTKGIIGKPGPEQR
jgi:UDP-N-acetylglucosamine acyltransferase